MIALLGGTFNPPHQGHINAGLDAINEIGVTKLGLLPCNVPPHKSAPETATKHRLAMLELACRQSSKLYVEPLELSLPAPNYTVKTLAYLRESEPDKGICFLLGEDSLYNLPSWYEWQHLTEFCHLVVMRRPASKGQILPILQDWLNTRLVDTPEALHEQRFGRVYITQSKDYSVSSTQLRNALGQDDPNDNTTSDWLHPDVVHYIDTHKLYRAE